MKRAAGITVGVLVLLATSGSALAATDTLVTSGAPQAPGTFPQNKQNEPGLALDPSHPTRIVAGANEEIDNALCGGSDCSFTPGVGDSGLYFSLGQTLGFNQPTYTGFSARLSPPGGPGAYPGPIGSVPWYWESGLVADGDPTLTFGPRPDSHGRFSWSNGSRLYYSNLTANTATERRDQTFKGFEAIAVSTADNVEAAAAGGSAGKAAWTRPVVVSSERQTRKTFSDKPTVWADNAASSPYFGRVYDCYIQFKNESDNTPAPIVVGHSADGGKTWTRPVRVSPAPTGGAKNKDRQGCDVNTDSRGRVYAAWWSTKSGQSMLLLARSDDGGDSFDKPRPIASVVDVGVPDKATTDIVFDGYAGARTDSFPVMDIANGAPTGQGASNKIAITWADARHGLNHEEALVEYSTNRGDSFSAPDSVAQAGDRPGFPAIALSPNGQRAYVVYMGFTAPFRETTSQPRPMQGVVRSGLATPGSAFTTLHRGTSGDARGASSNDLTDEFLGDYNWIAATNSSAVAVWNDVRAADDCPAIDAYRQSLIDGTPIPPPAPNACGNRFGNSDIYGARVASP